MKYLKLLLLSGMTLTLLQGCPTNDDRYGGSSYGGRGDYYSGDRDVDCGGNHNLRVVDLDMSPDPIRDDQRISRFRVQLRADGSGECETNVSIQLGGRTIASRDANRLRPGVNNITLTPRSGFKFDRDEECFQVLADIERTHKAVDSQRRFCAKRVGRGQWTLKD